MLHEKPDEVGESYERHSMFKLMSTDYYFFVFGVFFYNSNLRVIFQDWISSFTRCSYMITFTALFFILDTSINLSVIKIAGLDV